MKKCIIIGAGLGSLSASIHLAAKGIQVEVFETASHSGGKAAEIRLGPWRFDTGPSLLTLPHTLKDLFHTAGCQLEDHLTLKKLNPVTRYWFPNGKIVNSSSDTTQFAQSLSRAGIATETELRHYLNYSKKIWEITNKIFMSTNLHEPLQLIKSPGFWPSLIRLGQIDPLRSMNQAHKKFFHHPYAVQLFNRYATYNGSSPYKAPATLNLLPHVEYTIGSYAPRGGIISIPRTLQSLAQTLGVQFHFNQKVKEIRHSPPTTRITNRIISPRPRIRRTIQGITTEKGHSFNAPVVISNVDVIPTYQQLLKDPQAPLLKRYLRLEPSSSALVFLWAMGSDYTELLNHNIIFSENYPQEFHDIFHKHQCPQKPSIYINITSKTNPEDAPSPGENWFILINAPHDKGQDWQQEIARTRQAIIKSIQKALGKNPEPDIQDEHILTPPMLRERTSSHAGSLYGIASNTPQSAFRRHPNRSRRYPGLYFAGGSVHPGGGMPLAILSGKIASELALRHSFSQESSR